MPLDIEFPLVTKFDHDHLQRLQHARLKARVITILKRDKIAEKRDEKRKDVEFSEVELTSPPITENHPVRAKQQTRPQVCRSLQGDKEGRGPHLLSTVYQRQGQI